MCECVRYNLYEKSKHKIFSGIIIYVPCSRQFKARLNCVNQRWFVQFQWFRSHNISSPRRPAAQC